MSILRNKKCIVDWNEWKDKDRKEELEKKMEKIGRDWVEKETVI